MEEKEKDIVANCDEMGSANRSSRQCNTPCVTQTQTMAPPIMPGEVGPFDGRYHDVGNSDNNNDKSDDDDGGRQLNENFECMPSRLEFPMHPSGASSYQEVVDMLERLTDNGSQNSETDWHFFVRHTWLPVISMAFGSASDWKATYCSEEIAMLSLHKSLIKTAQNLFPKSSGLENSSVVPMAAGNITNPKRGTDVDIHCEKTTSWGNFSISSKLLDTHIGKYSVEDIGRKRMRRKRAASPDEEQEATGFVSDVQDLSLTVIPSSMKNHLLETLDDEVKLKSSFLSHDSGRTSGTNETHDYSNSKFPSQLDEDEVALLVSNLSDELASLTIKCKRQQQQKFERCSDSTNEGPKESDQWEGIVKSLSSIRELSEGPVWSLAQKSFNALHTEEHVAKQDQLSMKRAQDVMRFAARIMLADRKDVLGRTALHVAVQSRNIGMVNALVAAQCSVNAELPLDYRVFEILYDCEEVNSREEKLDQSSVLSGNRQLKSISDLEVCPLIEPRTQYTKHGSLVMGVSVPSPAPMSLRGATPLHLAAANGDTQSVQILLCGTAINVNAKTASGDTALHYACFAGQLNVVEILSGSKKTNLNATNEVGSTPIHMASAHGHTEIVEMLWSRGASIDPSDKFHWTPLHYASRNGHASVVKNLVIAGSYVQACDLEGVTAVHLAAERGYNEIVERILMAGFVADALAAPHTSDNLRGTTAMHLAASQGHCNVVSTLLRWTSSFSFSLDAFGSTALDLAISGAHFWTAKLLLNAKCDFRLPSIGGEESDSTNNAKSTEGEKLHNSKNFSDKEDGSPAQEFTLHYIGPNSKSTQLAKDKHDYIFERLEMLSMDDPTKHSSFKRSCPSDLIYKDMFSNDVSFFSCCAAAGKLEALKVLRSSGEKSVSAANDETQNKDSANQLDYAHALLLAVRAGHANVVEWLIKDCHCCPDISKQHVLIHHAVALGHTEVLRILISQGWDLFKVHAGTTALQESVAHGNLATTKIILESLGNVCNSLSGQNLETDILSHLEHQDSQGWTAMHYAASNGDLVTVNALLKHGASPSPVSRATGMTPIHIAAKKGYIRILRTLLKSGARASEMDNKFWTILHFFAQRGDLAAFSLFCGQIIPCFDTSSSAALLTASILGGSQEIVRTVLRYTGVTPEICCKANEYPVHAAAREGFVQALRFLHASGFDLNSVDETGRTPLHYVPTGYGRIFPKKHSFLDCARFLLEKGGCKVDAKDQHLCTPIHIAAGCGSQEMLDRFLIESTNRAELESWCNSKDKIGWTPLFWSSSEGHANAVTKLLSFGADPFILDSNNRNALHFAAERGHVDAVRTLVKSMIILKRNGDDNPMFGTYGVHCSDHNGATPISLAASKGHVEVVAFLLDVAPLKGNNVNEAESKRRNALHLAAQQGCSDIVHDILVSRRLHPSSKDIDGWTSLHHAAFRGHMKVIEQLIKFTAPIDVDDPTTEGDTALHKAALGGHSEVVRALLKARASTDARNATGSTPLYNASSQGHAETVRLLLHEGDAAVDAGTTNGCTPLYIAANNGWPLVCDLLLEHGAEIDVQATGDCTPMHAAAMNGHDCVIRLLLDKDAEVDPQSSNGSTPLHNAASNGHREVVSLLIEGGSDTEIENAMGNTPLHMAAGKGWIEVVEILLNAGADPSVKNQKGITPIISAANGGYFDVVLKMIQCGAPWRSKGDADVVKILSRKTTLKLSYIEGRLRLAEKERQRRIARASSHVSGDISDKKRCDLQSKLNDTQLKKAQEQADAAMAELLEEEQAEKAKEERRRAKKEAKRQKKAAQKAAEESKTGENVEKDDQNVPKSETTISLDKEGLKTPSDVHCLRNLGKEDKSSKKHLDNKVDYSHSKAACKSKAINMTPVSSPLKPLLSPRSSRQASKTAPRAQFQHRSADLKHNLSFSKGCTPRISKQMIRKHDHTLEEHSCNPGFVTIEPPPPPPPPRRALNDSLAFAPAMPIPKLAKAEKKANNIESASKRATEPNVPILRPAGPYAAALAGTPAPPLQAQLRDENDLIGSTNIRLDDSCLDGRTARVNLVDAIEEVSNKGPTQEENSVVDEGNRSMYGSSEITPVLSGASVPASSLPQKSIHKQSLHQSISSQPEIDSEVHSVSGNISLFNGNIPYPSLFQGIEVESNVHGFGMTFGSNNPSPSSWNPNDTLSQGGIQPASNDLFSTISSCSNSYGTNKTSEQSTINNTLGLGIQLGNASQCFTNTPDIGRSFNPSNLTDNVRVSPQQQYVKSSSYVLGDSLFDQDQKTGDADGIDDVLRLQPWLLE